MNKQDRRHFLRALMLSPLFLAGQKVFSMGEASQIGVGLIKHIAQFDHRPQALRRMLLETAKRTSIVTKDEQTILALQNPELFTHPLLVLTGEGSIEPFTQAQRNQLTLHLRYGGLLWIDSTGKNSEFRRSIDKELKLIFPQKQMQLLKKEHVLFKSFYLLDHAFGRSGDETKVYAYGSAARAQVLITECDVLGALERDRLGTWTYECKPDGEKQRERAIRFSVNLLMYALCLDYKSDQVHIPFIMKKKRR